MLWIGEIFADEVAMGRPNKDGRVVFVRVVVRFILIQCLVHLSCGRIERNWNIQSHKTVIELDWIATWEESDATLVLSSETSLL